MYLLQLLYGWSNLEWHPSQGKPYISTGAIVGSIPTVIALIFLFIVLRVGLSFFSFDLTGFERDNDMFLPKLHHPKSCRLILGMMC
jgi:hypothetical protein